MPQTVDELPSWNEGSAKQAHLPERRGAVQERRRPAREVSDMRAFDRCTGDASERWPPGRCLAEDACVS